MSVLLALLVSTSSVSSAPGELLAPTDPIHLTFELRAPDLQGMLALVAAQQDPSAPEFRRYLTPAAFGARFGALPGTYGELTRWLASGGLSLETFPNRLVVEATGSAAQVEALLHVTLRHVPGKPASMHVPDRAPELPAALAAEVLILTGLDSTHLHSRRLRDSYQNLTFGPQDLRRMYNLTPLLDAGFAGAGAQLVVLGVAEAPPNVPDPVDVNYFYRYVSDSRAIFAMDVLPNPANDFTGNGRAEDELDVEMQSVGAPEATRITLVMPPASEQFIAGANEVVNNLPNTTAVSISWGTCEPQELYGTPAEPAALRQLVLQGVLEGMTWSAAAGDNGSDDCQNSAAPSVDFPCDIPEMLALGGTQPQDAGWDAHDAIPGYQLEEVWNEGPFGGAGGGGLSVFFPRPAYQQSFPASFWPVGYLPQYGRALPDFSLLAAPSPGVGVDDNAERVIEIIGGTSVASPLSAGFLALVADRLGCRLGDLHPALYALGRGQLDGGPRVFHDITVGTNALDGLAGPDAGVGFDPASGWGSLDVAALAAALPPCPPLDAGFVTDAGPIDAGPFPPLTQGLTAYDPCATLACQAPTACVTAPEGPSQCAVACTDGTTVCPAKTACSAGSCVPGNPDGGQGAPCLTPVDCQPALTCFGGQFSLFLNGYCAAECGAGFPACAKGTLCDNVAMTGQFCVTACDGGCADPNTVCQPQPGTGRLCLPPCQVQADCDTLAPGSSCDAATGICLFLPDGGMPDSGSTSGSSSGSSTASSTSSSSTSSGGSGGSSGSATSGSSSGGTGSSGATSTSASSESTSTAGASASSASSSSSTNGLLPGEGAPGGCACSTRGGDGTGLWSLALASLVLTRRRRRRVR